MSRFGWIIIGTVNDTFLYFTLLLRRICMLVFLKERAAGISVRTE